MSAGPRGRLAAWWRQRRQPAAFRIDAPDWRRLAVDGSPPDPAPAPPPPPSSSSDDPTALATAATNVWAARRRVARAESTKESRHLSKLLRDSERALGDLGVEVQEHDGDSFHSGLALEAIYQEDPTVRVATVTKTRRPTVYVRGRHVQTGEVVVAVPVENGQEEADDA